MLKVTVEGVDKVLDNILTLTHSLDSKLQEICKRLADLGVDVARAWYDMGTIGGKQEKQTSVETIPTENGCMIRAYGDAVFFLEFGTGVYAQSNEMNTENLDTSPGSWSKDHVKMFTEKGYWYYKPTGFMGVGTEPYDGMNRARAEIMRNIDTIAKEVFTN